MWRVRFGRGFGPAVRQTAEWMNEANRHLPYEEILRSLWNAKIRYSNIANPMAVSRIHKPLNSIQTQFISLTYLLTPWCRVLPEQLTGLQLVKKFPAFHGTRRFITALTSVCHLSLSWASPVQSTYPHPTSWRSILILSTHLRLGLPSIHFKVPLVLQFTLRSPTSFRLQFLPF